MMDHSNGNTDSEVLSERGRQAHVAKLPMTYFRPIMEMLKNPWCVPDTSLCNPNVLKRAFGVVPMAYRLHIRRTPDNPRGNLILAVAENRLSCDLLGKRLHQVESLPDNIYGYPPGRGFPRLREAIAQYMKETFLEVRPSRSCQSPARPSLFGL